MMVINCGCSIRDRSGRFWHFFKSSLDKVANNGNKKMIQTCVIMFFALILSNAGTTLAGESMKLNENDSGKTIEIHVGDVLEVVLPGNPTTGYGWEVSSLDSTVLKLDRPEFLVIDKGIGSGVMEIIKLHAIAEGKSVVRLIFHRTFEQNIPPLKTFEVNVIIEK
jgi:inhibitor of cysteine peptidase